MHVGKKRKSLKCKLSGCVSRLMSLNNKETPNGVYKWSMGIKWLHNWDSMFLIRKSSVGWRQWWYIYHIE